MHKIGIKDNYLNYYDVSIFGHGGGVSQFTQFYDRIKNEYQILLCP